MKDLKLVKNEENAPWNWANSVVENMGCTMLHYYGYTLTTFPNVLGKVVEAIAYRDPHIVINDGTIINIGEAAIPTDLYIDVSDDGDGTEGLVEATELLQYVEINRREFIVEGTTLATDDIRGETNTKVLIKIVEYITDPNLNDTEDFKYHRCITAWFINNQSAVK
jgi:hypothetical protein